jgi:DNA-binding SARP family transcriptional activator/tetratricopeptide (TPR) repeat protein
MEFRLFGQVTVFHEGHRLELGRRRERLLLGLLLLEAGRVVPVDRLVDLLWGDDAPPSARASLRTHVARLRAQLAVGGVSLASRGDGYLADVDPAQVDVHAFRAQVTAAAQATSPWERAALLRGALTRCRGPLLGDVADDGLRARLGAGLDDLRMSTVELCAEAELAIGQGDQVIADLTELLQAAPTRERAVGVLMTALYQRGRQAEALAAYQRCRQVLVTELAVEPGPALRRLHEQVLRNDAALAPATGPAPAGGEDPPRFLPRDLPDFTGREEELARLTALAEEGRDAATAVVITAIAGTAGVGKTALAVHWAHRMADRFPHGQLYVNLRGYEPGQPARPIEALALFLAALGVPAEQIPVDTARAAGMYRSLLSGKRVLVLLDNATSAEQVRPLLPSSRTSLAVVTSRDRLGGLVARDGARRLTLDTLPAPDAVALLRQIVGDARVAAEPEATAALVARCGHLPLAVRIAAAILADEPERTIAAQVSALEEGNRLAALAVEGDEQTAVRAAFDSSYARLRPDSQRMFRLLSLAPGADVAVAHAAALADTGLPRAAEVLDRLCAAHLVAEHAAGRYVLHDLVRLYASERAAEQEHPRAREAALSRLYEMYTNHVDAAARRLFPHTSRLPFTPTRPVEFDSYAAAMDWLEAERPNLVAAVEYGATHRPRAAAVLLGDWLRGYFWLRRHVVDWFTVAQATLTAAMSLGDQRARAAAHLNLGSAYRTSGRPDEAVGHYRQAIEACREAGWLDGLAGALGSYGNLVGDLGDLRQAVANHREALAINRQLGRRSAQAVNLNNLGVACTDLGQFEQAVEYLTECLAGYRGDGVLAPQGNTLGNLGEVYRHQGRYDEAMACLREAVEVCRETGNLEGEATALDNIAAVRRDSGCLNEALAESERALAVVRRTGDPYKEAVLLNTYATIHSGLSGPADALGHHERALRLAREVAGRHPEADALIGLARARLGIGQPGAALDSAREALRVAREFGYRLLEGRALAAMADAYRDLGDPAQAEQHTRDALAAYRETGYAGRGEPGTQPEPPFGAGEHG